MKNAPQPFRKGVSFYLTLVSVLILSVFGSVGSFAAPPTGFAVEQLLTNLQQPLSMRFLPDERLLVVQKKGLVRISDVFALPIEDEIYMDLASAEHVDGLNSGNERGVLDIAFDPGFPEEAWIYVLYTPERGPNGQRMRVSRFPHVENEGGVTSRGDVTGEEILWEDTNGYAACCHFGGGLDFGPDGNLWISTGDHFQGSFAASITNAGGGIHRITKTGEIPAGNPFTDGPGPNVDSLVAYGLRNPFRARWDLVTNTYYIGEVGGNVQDIAWEDLHIIRWDPATNRIVDADFGTAADNNVFDGINFGWPNCEGLPPYDDFPGCNISSAGEPIFGYAHEGDTAAITGGAVNHNNQFPAEFEEAYFYADSTRDFIRYLKFNPDGSLQPNPNPDAISPLNPDALSYSFDLDPTGRIVALEMGPDGALYFVNFTNAGGDFGMDNPTQAGSIGRYVFDGGNARPVVAEFTQSATEGQSPLPVDFQFSASDPEGSPITYILDFGDGVTTGPAQALTENTLTTISHTYGVDGVYEVTLSLSDGSRTATERLTVEVGTPPEVVSLTPTNDRPGSTDNMFRFGDTIRFTPVATDVEDGALGAANYSWNVLFIRPGNVHPAFGPEDNLGVLEFEIPLQGQGFRGPVFYRCFLTVTDSSGLSTTTTTDIFPEKTNITFDTNPSGIFVQVDGNLAERTPFVLDTLVNFPHQISVPSSQCIDGFRYVFDQWSTGSSDLPLLYPAPVADSSLTASYLNAGECLEAPTDGLVLRLRASDGVILDNSNQVASWEDSSGNGNDLTALGEPRLLVAGLNGQSVISFDGIDDALRALSFNNLPTGAEDRSIFMLARYNQNNPGRGWAGFSYGVPQSNQAFGLSLTHLGTLGVQGWGTSDFESNPAVDGLGRWLNQGLIYSGQSLVQYDNGAEIGSVQHAFNTGVGSIRLGEELTGDRNLTMEVAEILVYDRAIDEAERLQIESYFEDFYQINVSRGSAPEIEVSFPQSNSFFAVDEMPLTLRATAQDAEDGDLSDAVTWSSDLQGFLGSGPAIPVNLEEGAHIITATVQDSDGLTVEDSVSVIVVGGNGSQLITDDLVMHLEADLNVGLQSADGPTVSAWLDQSGLGLDLIAGGDPEFLPNATPSGEPAIGFDGDDKLERVGAAGLPAGNAPRSMFMVARYRGASAVSGAAYGEGVENGAFGLGVDPVTGVLVGQGWGQGNDLVSNELGAGEGWLTQAIIYDGAMTRLYRQGIQIAEFNHTYDTVLTRISLGEEISGLGFADLDIAALLIYDAHLNDGERLQTESYLSTKYLRVDGPVEIAITEPLDGSLFFADSVVGLSASVVNEPLDASVEWSSSIDGVLGSGEDLTVSSLSTGAHLISVEVSDEGVVVASDTVSISVGILNENPVVVIGAPTNGAMFVPSGSINLSGGALDAEDGSLSGVISWASDLDGNLGQGSSINVSLSEGVHQLTASVVDSAGATALDSIRVNISVPDAGNLVEDGLVFRLESDSGLVSDDGFTVSSWLDQTVSGNDLAAFGDPAILPSSTPSGLTSVRFDGEDDKLERLDAIDAISGLPLLDTDRTMFIVTNYRSVGGFGGVAYGTGAVNQAFGLGISDPSGELILQGWGAGNDLNSNVSGLGAGWMTQSAVLTGGNATLYQGGQEIAAFAHNFNTVAGKLVIAEEISGAGFIGMDVAAVLIYDRALSAAERDEVENYLQSKYLMVSSIASGPTLRISSPPNGSVFDDNAMVRLFGVASDVQQSLSVEYEPTEDVYLQNGSNRHFGDPENLRLENSDARQRVSYLQFNLPDMPSPPIGATVSLKLSETGIASSGEVTVRLYQGLQDDGSEAWEEETINQSRAPSKGPEVAVFSGIVAEGAVLNFDLSSVITEAGIYHFILEMEADAGDLAFVSKESPLGDGPVLRVLVADPSESIQWRSDLDGLLGVGGTLVVPGLSPGQHLITAELDGEELALSDSITVDIVDQQNIGIPISAGLALQLESTDNVSVVGQGELSVTEWADLTSSGNTVFADGAPQFLENGTPSGEPALIFDGVDDQLSRLDATDPVTGLSAGSSDRTMFIVANYQMVGGFAGVAYGDGSPNSAFGLGATPTGDLVLQGWGGNNDLIAEGNVFTSGWLVQSGVVSEGIASLYRDGVEVAQFSHVYDTSIESLVIGREIGGAGFAQMSVAAVLVFDRALSPSQRVAVESYLQNKYLTPDSANQLTVGNAPVIVGPEVTSLTLEAGEAFLDPGAYLVDAEDGIRRISSSLVVDTQLPGLYNLQYEGVDSDGNVAPALILPITVVDSEPGVIVAEEETIIHHMAGNAFNDPGAVVFDNVDKPLQIFASSVPSGLAAGEFSLVYNSVDSAGNVSETLTIPVMVTDPRAIPLTVQLPIDPEGETVVSVNSVAGFSYTLEVSADLVTWTTVSSQDGTGGALFFADSTTEEGTTLVYRLAISEGDE